MKNGSCSYEACTNWLKPAATGLRDILQSRVDADKRISALHFASLLTQQFSLRWTFLTEINKRLVFSEKFHFCKTDVRTVIIILVNFID